MTGTKNKKYETAKYLHYPALIEFYKRIVKHDFSLLYTKFINVKEIIMNKQKKFESALGNMLDTKPIKNVNKTSNKTKKEN